MRGLIARRSVITLTLLSFVIGVIFFSGVRELPARPKISRYQHDSTADFRDDTALGQTTLTGHAIAPKLGNETIKAELGRAAWKLFHTTMARFPDKPTMEESAALKTYIHLFQRLYPCGECAEHFGELLQKYPPQVSSRSAAAAWACHVHNQVNISLKKEVFDCAKIGDFYDCGCADDGEEKEEGVKVGDRSEMSRERLEKLSMNGRDFDTTLVIPERPA